MNTQQYGIENEARTAVEIWIWEIGATLKASWPKTLRINFPPPGEWFISRLCTLFSKKKNIPAKLQPKVQKKKKSPWLSRADHANKKKKKNNHLGRIRKRGQRDVRGNDNAFSLSFPRPIAGLFVTRLLTMVKRKQKVSFVIFSLRLWSSAPGYFVELRRNRN